MEEKLKPVNFRDEYPYVRVDRERFFFEGEFVINDSMPPSLKDKSASMEDVFYAIEDLKRLVRDKCQKGHRIGAKKMSDGEICTLLNQLQDLIYEKSNQAHS